MIYRYDEPRIEAASVSYITAFTGLSNQTTYTLSGINFGSEVKGRNKRHLIAVLKYGAVSGFSVSITNASIGGFSASQVLAVALTTATGFAARWYVIRAEVPTGTSGSLVFTDNTGNTPSVDIVKCINLDTSSVIDSASDSGTSVSNLALDCPASGAIIGYGTWGYAGGSGPATSAPFANLTNINFPNTYAATIFASAQSNLNTNFTPLPSSGLTRVEAMAFSFAKNPLI